MTNEQWQIAQFLVQLALAAGVGYATAAFRVGQLVQKLETVCSDVSDMRKEMKDIRDMAVASKTLLDNSGPLWKRKSPLALTDLGGKFLERSGGKKFVDENFEELHAAISSRNPKTPYDVQEYAREAIASKRDDDRMNPIKTYLFQDGSSFEDLIVVMGIYLRDKSLKKMDWKVEDVDRHDPKIPH